jgi:hypothetical protein
MASFSDNPFAALTIVVAPAILTNASSVLCLGTGNRIARVVDRTRFITTELAGLRGSDARRDLFARQLDRLKVRAQLLLRALRLFYISLASFASAALISVFGSVLAGIAGPLTFGTLAALGLVSGTVGVTGLVVGCALMVQETRLAVRNLTEEAKLATYSDDTVGP